MNEQTNQPNRSRPWLYRLMMLQAVDMGYCPPRWHGQVIRLFDLYEGAPCQTLYAPLGLNLVYRLVLLLWLWLHNPLRFINTVAKLRGARAEIGRLRLDVERYKLDLYQEQDRRRAAEQLVLDMQRHVDRGSA